MNKQPKFHCGDVVTWISDEPCYKLWGINCIRLKIGENYTIGRCVVDHQHIYYTVDAGGGIYPEDCFEFVTLKSLSVSDRELAHSALQI